MSHSKLPADYLTVLLDMEKRYVEVTREQKILEAKEQVLRISIASLKRLINLEVDSQQPMLKGVEEVQIAPDAFANLGVIEAAYKCLKTLGRPMSNRALTEALLDHGFQTESKTPNETIRTSLKQRGRPMGIVFSHGQWWLLEWPQTPPEGSQDADDVGDIEAY
jgi:hypothetical protein